MARSSMSKKKIDFWNTQVKTLLHREYSEYKAFNQPAKQAHSSTRQSLWSLADRAVRSALTLKARGEEGLMALWKNQTTPSHQLHRTMWAVHHSSMSLIWDNNMQIVPSLHHTSPLAGAAMTCFWQWFPKYARLCHNLHVPTCTHTLALVGMW